MTERGPTLRTRRMLLRRWRDDDRTPFAAINADPEVCRFLPHPLDRAESDELVDRIEEHFEREGFGLWAVEIPGVTTCAGFVGLARPGFEAHFTPAVEVGWRLSPSVWGKGYATEGARAALDYAFGVAGLQEVVSFTVPANEPSRAVMRRLGMTHDPTDDFEHPLLAAGHPLRRHVLYRARPGAPGLRGANDLP